VLIVDDDEVFGKSLESRLRDDDRIEIVGRATRGTDALRLTRELQPDVVLMDIAMPRMDGLTAARRLRKTCPAQRASPCSSSCTCGSSFRFLPQTGQSPAQSGRQRICSGSASAIESRAHAERSTLSSTT
jgi:CheY-like chemotaxis protein